MVCIYVQNKPLFLIDKVNSVIDGYLHQPETIFMDELNASAIDKVLKELEKGDVYAGVFRHSDVTTLLNAFKSRLTPVKAGGGFVCTATKEVLFIFRRGKWDLPKGKLDEGEELEACAIREVKEETGIENISIVKPLQITYHTYYEKGQHILKESHWYLMNIQEATSLVPQTEEDIEKCIWIPLAEIQNFTGNMHASIVDVVQEAEGLLRENA